MKRLVLILSTIFTIIGTIIGAGFISGREILTFYYGYNIILSTLISLVIFGLSMYALLSFEIADECFILKCFEPIILFGNFIVLSSMLAGFDEIIFSMFPKTEKFSFFSIIALILSFFTISKGISGIKFVNLFLVPFIIIFLIIFLPKFSSPSETIILSNNVNILKILSYVGLNQFLSVPVFSSLGKSLNKKQAILTSVLTSVLLCFLIFFIYIHLASASYDIINSPLPTLSLFIKNAFVSKLFSIIMIIGVLTTLFSTHYPLYNFANNFKYKKLSQIILMVCVFSVSRLGFYKIVSYIYPILGAFGVIYIILMYFLSIFKDKEKH